jgi:hypothetical protein
VYHAGVWDRQTDRQTDSAVAVLDGFWQLGMREWARMDSCGGVLFVGRIDRQRDVSLDSRGCLHRDVCYSVVLWCVTHSSL